MSRNNARIFDSRPLQEKGGGLHSERETSKRDRQKSSLGVFFPDHIMSSKIKEKGGTHVAEVYICSGKIRGKMMHIASFDAHVWSHVRQALCHPWLWLKLGIGHTTIQSQTLHKGQSSYQIAAVFYDFMREVSRILVATSSYSPALWYVNGAALIARVLLSPTQTLTLEVHHFLQHISLAIRLSTCPGQRVLLFSQNSWISPKEEELLTTLMLALHDALHPLGEGTKLRSLHIPIEISANPLRYAADLAQIPCGARLLSCGWTSVHCAAFMSVWRTKS